MSVEHDPNAASCGCVRCAGDLPFEMPPQLADACREGDLVIFAGAGISTESPAVVQPNFYWQVFYELLDLGNDLSMDDPPAFPSLMTAFEEARGRHALLRSIKRHFDYVRSFPSIDRHARAFSISESLPARGPR